MISNKNYFKGAKKLPVDKFFENVLFDKKIGYYSSKIPFGSSGDFLTAPLISTLFSEIIGIWLIVTLCFFSILLISVISLIGLWVGTRE